MKLVKNLVFAGLLVSTITLNTFAGDQHGPAAVGTPPPPPPSAVIIIDKGNPYTEQPIVIMKPKTTDYLLFEALAALLSVY